MSMVLPLSGGHHNNDENCFIAMPCGFDADTADLDTSGDWAVPTAIDFMDTPSQETSNNKEPADTGSQDAEMSESAETEDWAPTPAKRNKVDEIDQSEYCGLFFQPARRLSMVWNSKMRLKEERKKVLKLSICKLRQIDDPEVFLRRSVLINNTIRRLHREIREEKLSRMGRLLRPQSASGIPLQAPVPIHPHAINAQSQQHLGSCAFEYASVQDSYPRKRPMCSTSGQYGPIAESSPTTYYSNHPHQPLHLQAHHISPRLECKAEEPSASDDSCNDEEMVTLPCKKLRTEAPSTVDNLPSSHTPSASLLSTGGSCASRSSQFGIVPRPDSPYPVSNMEGSANERGAFTKSICSSEQTNDSSNRDSEKLSSYRYSTSGDYLPYSTRDRRDVISEIEKQYSQYSCGQSSIFGELQSVVFHSLIASLES